MNNEQKRKEIIDALEEYFEAGDFEKFMDKLLDNKYLVRKIFSEQYKNEDYTYGDSFEEISLFLETASNQDITIIYDILLDLAMEEKLEVLQEQHNMNLADERNGRWRTV